MPYSRVEDLPSAVRGKLRGKKLRQWMHVFNSAYDRHGDESRAFAEAWSTAQKMEKAMSDFQVFLPIAKVDEKKRTVSGYASTPTKDSDGEIVTLEAVRSALPDYMTWGNIREMHALKAVGVAKEANMDTKGLFLTAKIVDDNAWNKCLEGVYKGFSIGGRKLAKEGDKITEIELTEVSVVDRPANPDCKITLAKSRKEHAEGYLVKPKSEKTSEQKALVKMARAVELLAKDGPPAAHDGFSLPAPVDKTIPETTIPAKEPDGVDSPKDDKPEENVTRKTEPDTTKGGDAPGEGDKPYGNVEYADPGHQADGKKRYPVDNEKHIRAAWSYINKPKNAAKYSPGHASSVRSKIVSAWKKKIHPDGPPSVSKKIAKKLKKLEKRQRMAEFLNNRFALRRAAPALEIAEAEDDSLEKFELRKSGDETMEDNKEDKIEFAKTGDPLADAVGRLLAKAAEPPLTKRLAMADDNVRKARKAMKECRKAIEQAHKMHKAAYFAKADGAKPSGDGDSFDHAGAMEKLQKAYGELDKARIFGKAAIGDIAKASGSVGQSGQQAGDSDSPYYEVPPGVKHLGISALAGAGPGTPGGGGQPPEYPGDGSVYSGKASVSDDLKKYAKDGQIPAAVAELLIAKGRTEAELEALRRVPASAGRRPYAFDITKAVGGAEPNQDNRSLFEGVDVAALGSGDERAHTEASAKVIGNFLTSGKFGKSVLDPTFRGAAGSK